MTGNGNGGTLYGQMTLESGLTLTDEIPWEWYNDNPIDIYLAGKSLGDVGFYGTSSVTLQSNLTSTGQFYQENGTFDANNYNVTAGNFYFYADTGFEPTVYMGSGTWEANGDDNVWGVDEYNEVTLTVVRESSTIKLASTAVEGTQQTFQGGGKTYNNIWLVAGVNSTEFYIKSNNTFNDFKIDEGLTVYFGDGSTQIVSSFTASGTAGNLIVLDSDNSFAVGALLEFDVNDAGTGYAVDDVITVSGGNGNATIYVNEVDGSGVITDCYLDTEGSGYSIASDVGTTGGSGEGFTIDITEVYVLQQFTLSKSSGDVECDYLDISNSNATGGATWYAGDHSNDTSNNDGWIFSSPPSESRSPSASLSPSVSESRSPSLSPSLSESISESLSLSLSPSLSESRSVSLSPSISESRSISLSESRSPSLSPSVSVSLSPSLSPSISESRSQSLSVSLSPSLSESLSLSLSPSVSESRSPSISPSASVSLSPSLSPSLSVSASESLSQSVSESASPSPSIPPDEFLLQETGFYLLQETGDRIILQVGASASPSASESPSPSVSISASPSVSESKSISLSPSVSESVSVSPSPSPPEYEDKYTIKNTPYTDKYSDKGTSYVDKYSDKNTSYSNKYNDKGTVYADKYSKKNTSYSDKYRAWR